MSDDEEALGRFLEAIEINHNDRQESSLDRNHRLAFNAARDGQALTLYALLKDQAIPERNHILKEPVQDVDGQCCPLLVIAARNGHDNVVTMLLTMVSCIFERLQKRPNFFIKFQFDIDIEATGRVKFENYIIDGASALWCASGAGHLKVVGSLVAAGADVNHTTKTKSTPLRAACFDGRIEIVKYLIDVGNADFNIANKFNNTCLMIAAFKNHVHVVRY